MQLSVCWSGHIWYNYLSRYIYPLLWSHVSKLRSCFSACQLVIVTRSPIELTKKGKGLGIYNHFYKKSHFIVYAWVLWFFNLTHKHWVYFQLVLWNQNNPYLSCYFSFPLAKKHWMEPTSKNLKGIESLPSQLPSYHWKIKRQKNTFFGWSTHTKSNLIVYDNLSMKYHSPSTTSSDFKCIENFRWIPSDWTRPQRYDIGFGINIGLSD